MTLPNDSPKTGPRALPAPKTELVSPVEVFDRAEQLKHWPRSHEVSEILQCSVSKVKHLQNKGKLHPQKDAKGDWRFDPDEVGVLCIELGIDDAATNEWKAKAYGRIDLYSSLQAYKMATDNLSVVARRADQLDRRTDGMLDRLERRNAELESQVDRYRARLDEVHELKEKLQDRTDEREAFKAMVSGREERWTKIVGNMMRHFDAFMEAGKEIPFLHSLNGQLLEAIKGGIGDVMPDESLAALERAIDRQKAEDEKARAAKAEKSAAEPATEAPKQEAT